LQSGTKALHSASLGRLTDSGRLSQGYAGQTQEQAMTDYSQYSGIQSVSSMALSYGDMSIPHPAMHSTVRGPQTYSGLRYERANIHRAQTEFGIDRIYAVYGGQTSVSNIINGLKRDKKNGTMNPNLVI
jgi:hypothetical protein